MAPGLAFGGSLAAVLLAGCDEPRARVEPEVEARAVALGQPAAAALKGALGSQLQAAMAEGGPAHAIAFCAERAQALTDSVAASRGQGWVVRRTTDRPRNPANAPDPTDAEALRAFQAADRAGTPLEHRVLLTPEGAVRYYEPLRAAGLCLECHGPRERLSPEVATVLAERYPADAAVGYEEGDLRGLVRVTVPSVDVR